MFIFEEYWAFKVPEYLVLPWYSHYENMPIQIYWKF